MPGEELVITAGIGAFSKAAQPTVSIDGANVPLNAEGTAEYKTKVGVSGAGIKRVRISYAKPDGTTAVVEKEVKYTVGVPGGLTLSTDATRVFYKGLKNPLSITGAGGAQNLKVSITGPAGISIENDRPGHYFVTSPGLGEAVITASDGKNTQIVKIPIKRVPDPIVMIGGNPGGTMKVSTFRVQSGLIPELKDFVFEGVTYKVASFTIIFSGNGFQGYEFVEVKGPSWNNDPAAKELIKKCQDGTTVQFGDIKVIEPGVGGTTRPIPGNISFILEQ
jgi:hypothetical protein